MTTPKPHPMLTCLRCRVWVVKDLPSDRKLGDKGRGDDQRGLPPRPSQPCTSFHSLLLVAYWVSNHFTHSFPLSSVRADTRMAGQTGFCRAEFRHPSYDQQDDTHPKRTLCPTF